MMVPEQMISFTANLIEGALRSFGDYTPSGTLLLGHDSVVGLLPIALSFTKITRATRH